MADQGDSPQQIRRFIEQTMPGGIQKLLVPTHDTDLPQPRLPDGSPDPRFTTTEAKRYLGKLLFHDPVRTVRILTGIVQATLVSTTVHGRNERWVYRLTNTGPSAIDTHLLAIPSGLSLDIEMLNASGQTEGGTPYRRLFLPEGILAPGRTLELTLEFRRRGNAPPVSFSLTLLSGQGTP